jgi:pyrimidine operon attenuation protein/uracil phosphoribosyltransferase
MEWLRDKVLNDEIRCFAILGLLGILELLNLGFLGGMPYRSSIIISVLLFVIAIYLFILQYKSLKERYKSFLHKNHLELVSKIEGVEREVSCSEDRLTNLATDHYKELNKFIDKATEAICTAIESSEKNVASLSNKNKEELLEDAKNHADVMEKHILQNHKSTSNQVNQIMKELVSEVQNRSQQLVMELGQVDKTISELIKSEANQLGLFIGDVRDNLTNSLNELKEQQIQSTDNLLEKSIQTEVAAIESIQSVGSQMGLVIEGVSEQLVGMIDDFKKQSAASVEKIIHHSSQTNDNVISSVKLENQQMGSLISQVSEQMSGSLNELREQNNRITDHIIEKTGQIQETVTNSIQTEGSQLGALIDDVRVQMASSINELKDNNLQSSTDLLEKASQTEDSVISTVKSESNRMESLINLVSEQMSGSVDVVKEQNDRINDHILEKTNQIQEMVTTSIQTEGSQLGALIDDVRVQMTGSLNELKDHNLQSKIDLLEKTSQTEESIVSSMKLEGNQIGALIGEVREQLASTLDEMKEHNNQSTIEIISKTSQDYLAVANEMNEGIQTKWRDITSKMESFDNHNENRFNRTKETIDSAIVSMKSHSDQSAHFTTSRLVETFEQLSDQNVSKVSTTILDVNQTIGQTLYEMENHVLEKMDWLNLDQVELKKLISESIQKDIENKDNVLQQVNYFSEKLIGIQNKAFQNVLDQVSKFRVEQLDSQNANNEEAERKYTQVNEQVNGLSKNLLTIEESMKKTILQFDSWKKEQLQKGDKILDMLSKVYELDSNLGQASKHLFERQETFGEKVDALIFQMNSIDALIKSLKSSGGNAKNVSVEEKQQGANRIEKINDEENGVLIINQYEKNVIRNSEMHQNGKKIYLAEYDKNGIMIASKNFDQAGKVLTEMTYFPNGAIKERKENVKRNGKVVAQVSKFNQNGVKIK